MKRIHAFEASMSGPADNSSEKLGPTFAAVETTRIEVHNFETMTLINKQFLMGAKEGVPARIGGALYLPTGTERVAAVVLLHGSGGIGANVDRWARQLNGIGVAAFVLDSFTGRGIVETITDQSQLGHLAMILDAYRALKHLSDHRRIDPSRIAAMGFSKGGSAALYASLTRFQAMHRPEGAEFSGYLALYPQCNTSYLEDERTSDRPIRLFHGTADNYVSIEPCRSYVGRLRRAGSNVELTEYPGAHHVFDNPVYSPPRTLPDAVTTIQCSLEERAVGEIVHAGTGSEFTWSDACVKRGATVGYDPAATTAATRAVKASLFEWFGLSA
ncbi:MAG: dienelactone hydrolase family protein [Candidatus Acidiferrum sp.]